MDALLLRRHIKELQPLVARRPQIIRVVAVNSGEIGLVLRDANRQYCLEIRPGPGPQSLQLSPTWDEATVETAFLRSLRQHLGNTFLVALEMLPTTENVVNPDVTHGAGHGAAHGAVHDDIRGAACGAALYERVVRLRWCGHDRFFAEKQRRQLVVELTGRINNVLLLDDTNMVIDQLRQTGNNHLKSLYSPPPPAVPGMPLDPAVATDAALTTALAAPPETWMERLAGLSPLFVRELAWRIEHFSVSNTAMSVNILRELWHEAVGTQQGLTCPRATTPVPATIAVVASTAGDARADQAASPNAGMTTAAGIAVFSPAGDAPVHVYVAGNKLLALTSMCLRHLSVMPQQSFDTVNEALVWVQQKLSYPRQLEQVRRQMLAGFNRNYTAITRAIAEEQARLQKFQNAQQLKHLGEIILCHLQDIPVRAGVVALPDWQTGQTVEIPLEPDKTPAQNAQRYFVRYKKAQRGEKLVSQRLAALAEEGMRLQEQIIMAEQAENISDLVVPKTEKLRKFRGQRSPVTAGSFAARSLKALKARVRPFLVSADCQFWVGRNCRQNDLITFTVAHRGDLWFHAQKVPGSHVVARRVQGPFTDDDRYVGAVLAAWFSGARTAGKVAVDYTGVAHVRRIPGGGPGQVNYVQQKTLFVNPADFNEISQNLLKSASSEASEP